MKVLYVLFNQMEKIPIIFRRSSKARSLRLQINLDEPQVILTAPKFAMAFEINRFLKSKQSWIEKHLDKALKKANLRPRPQYKNGDTFYYFGEPVSLVINTTHKKRPDVKIRGEKMYLTINDSIAESKIPLYAKKAIQDYYRKKAEEAVHDRLQNFNEHYGFKYNRVTLRNQKSRWGSCTSRGNLNFNWRLIMAPIEVIDYVIVHELCHLKQMNHSKNFWNLVAEMVPKYKVYRKWLRENQYLLKI